MRMALLAAWLAVGCGRVAFDDATVPADAALDGPDAPVPPDTLLEGCVVRMKMDEEAWTGATGEVIDGCGGHHGTASGGATTIDDAERGRVGVFAGDPACVQVADTSAIRPAGALTASAWIYAAALAPASFGVISKRIDFGNNTMFSVFVWTDTFGAGTTNQIYVDIDGEGDRIPDPTTTYLNAWRQITVVYDGSAPAAARTRFYVDGALTFTASETSATITPPALDAPLSIGCLPLGTPAQSFIGRLDDVMLWSRALSPAEVQQWYAATK